jgi:hypothetical protein
MSRTIAVRFAALMLVASLTGCTATIGGYGILNPAPGLVADPQQDPEQWNLKSDSGESEPAAAAPPAAEPVVVLTVKPQWGRTKHYTLPLTQGMSVQTALESQRLPRRFRNMDINVVRVTPYSNGHRVPLRAEYDTVKNRVGILHDMLLLPGDHVLVEENNKTQFDEMLGGLLGAHGRR